MPRPPGLTNNFPLAIRGTAATTTNNPPTVATAIPDQTATAGTAFSYAFPDTTFSDADTGDTLTYTATKADDTALPTWLDSPPARAPSRARQRPRGRWPGR